MSAEWVGTIISGAVLAGMGLGFFLRLNSKIDLKADQGSVTEGLDKCKDDLDKCKAGCSAALEKQANSHQASVEKLDTALKTAVEGVYTRINHMQDTTQAQYTEIIKCVTRVETLLEHHLKEEKG